MTNPELRQLVTAITEGPVTDKVPEKALPARGCRCETPWLEREPDGQLHCCRCGVDYRP